jgi:hypothetical protein
MSDFWDSDDEKTDDVLFSRLDSDFEKIKTARNDAEFMKNTDNIRKLLAIANDNIALMQRKGGSSWCHSSRPFQYFNVKCYLEDKIEALELIERLELAQRKRAA